MKLLELMFGARAALVTSVLDLSVPLSLTRFNRKTSFQELKKIRDEVTLEQDLWICGVGFRWSGLWMMKKGDKKGEWRYSQRFKIPEAQSGQRRKRFGSRPRGFQTALIIIPLFQLTICSMLGGCENHTRTCFILRTEPCGVASTEDRANHISSGSPCHGPTTRRHRPGVGGRAASE